MVDFLKQTDKALFEDILWQKPENKSQLPNVVIVGGTKRGFAEVMQLFEATKHSSKQARLLLPDSLNRLVGNNPETTYLPSSDTGEIGIKAKEELLAAANWADVVIYSGDLGNNSQTELLLNECLAKITVPQIFIGHSVMQIKLGEHQAPTILVANIGELSKFNQKNGGTTPLMQTSGFIKKLEDLRTIATELDVSIVSWVESQVVVASAGKISATKKEAFNESRVASSSLPYYRLFESKLFESLSVGVFES